MATTLTTSSAVRRALSLAFVVIGCSSPAAQPPATTRVTPSREAPALAQLSLPELVPAAGLRWLVVGQPRNISENAALSAAIATLVPSERLRAYEEGTGVDLTRLPSAVVAGFDLGTLYLAELPDASGHRALERFVDRLAGRAVLERPHPRVVRATGTLDGTPHALVDLDGRVVALSSADLTLSRIATAYALGQLKRSPPALRGAALSTLPAPTAAALATFYAPGPFDNEWAYGARGILAAALAVAITIEPAADGHVRVTVLLSGDWRENGQAAADLLRNAFDELASSSTGKLFAFERARSVSASFHPQYLTLSAELPLDPLVRGLRAAVIADVWEILDLPAPASSDDSARP